MGEERDRLWTFERPAGFSHVRELEQTIHDACDNCSGSVIGPDHFPFAFRAGIEAQLLMPRTTPTVQSLDELLKNAERRILKATLRSCHNNKAEVARRLGLTRPSLYRRLRSLDVEEED